MQEHCFTGEVQRAQSFEQATPVIEIVKDIIAGVAEMLPTRSAHEKGVRAQLPVDAPNFPNDLDPVIRAYPPDPILHQLEENMSKYDRWRGLLLTLDADEIDVMLQQLDDFASPPNSAHKDAEWRANE